MDKKTINKEQIIKQFLSENGKKGSKRQKELHKDKLAAWCLKGWENRRKKKDKTNDLS